MQQVLLLGCVQAEVIAAHAAADIMSGDTLIGIDGGQRLDVFRVRLEFTVAEIPEIRVGSEIPDLHVRYFQGVLLPKFLAGAMTKRCLVHI